MRRLTLYPIIFGMLLSAQVAYASPTAGFVNHEFDTGYENPTQFIFENYIDWDAIEVVEEEEIENPVPKNSRWENWEIELVKQVCMREARGEPLEGILAICDVIMNRVDDPRFPNDIYGVLTQKNQFTEEHLQKEVYELNFNIPDDLSLAIEDRMNNGSFDSNILYFSSGFYNPYCIPCYTIGNHYFGM